MFDNMVKDFKEHSELMLFCKSQHVTITDLSKKIVRLEEENIHLKRLLETTTDFIKPVPKLIDLSQSDEEIIVKIQISMIKDNALNRELTLEECKKLEIYTKILKLAMDTSKNTIEVSAKEIPTDDLMKMLNSDG